MKLTRTPRPDDIEATSGKMRVYVDLGNKRINLHAMGGYLHGTDIPFNQLNDAIKLLQAIKQELKI